VNENICSTEGEWFVVVIGFNARHAAKKVFMYGVICVISPAHRAAAVR
jgi:hypothetical protein